MLWNDIYYAVRCRISRCVHAEHYYIRSMMTSVVVRHVNWLMNAVQGQFYVQGSMITFRIVLWNVQWYVREFPLTDRAKRDHLSPIYSSFAGEWSMAAISGICLHNESLWHFVIDSIRQFDGIEAGLMYL